MYCVLAIFSWVFTATASNSVSSTPLGGGVFQINKTSGTWDGFSVGDTFYMTWTDDFGAHDANGTITSLSGTTMIATGVLPDSSLVGFINSSVEITGTSPLTASVYKFGLVGNSESFSVESKVSENDQGYYGNGRY